MYLTFVPSFGRVSNGFGRTLAAVTVIDGGFEAGYIFRIRGSPTARENIQTSFE
jgi:1,4-dihydroxy-2-naphthoyl-CoA synthase